MKKYYLEIISLVVTALFGVLCLYMAFRTYKQGYHKLKAQVDNANNAH